MTPPRAKPVLAWGIVRSDGRLALIAFPRRPDEEMLLPGERVARVEIREIEEGQTMSKADGGPFAFPLTSVSGMTLRDWFAGQALAGMNANRGWNERSWKAMARDAFRAADAMLAARGGSDDQ